MFRSKARSKFVTAVTVPIVAATLILLGAPQVALGATPLPLVLTFTASRTALPHTGGKLVLNANLRFASSCQITVVPSLNGFPKTFKCSSNRVAESVTLRANKGPSSISYSFGMNLKNKAGSAVATNSVVVTEAAAPPPISFTPPPPGNPTTLVFAPEGVSVSGDPLVVTVKNDSNTTQLVTTVAIGTSGEPTDFLLNRNNCGYITAHATCSLAVQFQPTGTGVRTGVVDVLDASWGTTGATAQLNLRGTGVWARAALSNVYIAHNILIFPTTQVLYKQSLPQDVSVSNVGNVPLYISGISVTGGESTDFTVVADTCINGLTPIPSYPYVVSIGQTCTFQVAFEPSGTGTRTSNVVVDDNTLGTQTQLEVQGIGITAPA